METTLSSDLSSSEEEIPPTPADYFSTLTSDEQHRLAPAYILLLKQQLAQAEIRHQKLLKALNRFDPEGGVYGYPNLHEFNKKMNKLTTCRNCFIVSPKDKVYFCCWCDQAGCEKCNSETKKVVKCSRCENNVCEKCDAGILFYHDEIMPYTKSGKNVIVKRYECSVCSEVEKISQELETRLEKLQKGEITRSQAVLTWVIGGPPITNPKEPTFSQCMVYNTLDHEIHESWAIFEPGHEDETYQDFPDSLSYSFIFLPKYSVSPKSRHLVTTIIFLFFDDDEDQQILYAQRIYEMLDFEGQLSRKSLTAGDIISIFLETEDPNFGQEKVRLIREKNPGFWERVFD